MSVMEDVKLSSCVGRAIAQAVSRWLPTAAGRVRVRAGMCVLWWTKRHWGRFSPSTSVSPANHSTNFSIIIITRDWHNRPIIGRSAEWTQLDLAPPPPYQLEKHSSLKIIQISSSWSLADISQEFYWSRCSTVYWHCPRQNLFVCMLYALWSALNQPMYLYARNGWTRWPVKYTKSVFWII
jgi:hypothetical protein